MGGHNSGGLFPGTIGNLATAGLFSIAHNHPSDSKSISNPVTNSIRTGSALKLDEHHAFPDIVDNYASYARHFTIVGGDGKKRLLLQLEGSLNGIPGVFEWIVDPDPTRGVTHRRFIGQGIITGKPNQHPSSN